MIAVAAGLGFFALLPARALAHCDGLDGPVVQAAQRALDTRNPALVLIWVQEKDEPEIRKAFQQTLAVRELSPQAREPVSYTHLRAHETPEHLVCRLLLEK